MRLSRYIFQGIRSWINSDSDAGSEVLQRPGSRGNSRHHRALGLAEALISLAITSLLLTAIASAFQASSSAVDMNDQFYRAQQSARISMNQILDQLRQCQSGVVGSTSLQLTDSTATQRTYALSGTNLTLTFIPTGQTFSTTTNMASNISSLSFTTDGKSVAVQITVTVGENKLTLCGSAFPRRLVVYD